MSSLVVALAVLGGCGNAPPGRWVPTEPVGLHRAELEAIGYAEGTMAPTEEVGVVLARVDAMMPGHRAYVSGHSPASIEITPTGEEVGTVGRDYRWSWGHLPWVWNDFPGAGNFRRARRLGNGDIAAVHEGLGLIRMDPGGHLVFGVGLGAHHDVVEASDGTLLALGREAREDPAFATDRTTWFDALLVLDGRTGEVRRRFDLVAALMEAGHGGELAATDVPHDPVHANSVRPVAPELRPAFGGAQVLVSSRNLSAVFGLDLDSGAVLWWTTGPFRHQHDAVAVPGPGLLLFDNAGLGKGHSRAVELSVPDGKVAWQWRGPPGRPLDSPQLGSVARTPKGTTLVTSSEQGVAYEVTRDGEIVWEFHNPHRAGAQQELVAALFEVMVVP